MLFALRSGMFSKEILPSFIATLRAVVKANFSTEVVRTLATFVTSFSQKGTGYGDIVDLGKSSRPMSKSLSSPVKRAFTFGDESDPPKPRKVSSAAKDGVCYEVIVLEMLV